MTLLEFNASDTLGSAPGAGFTVRLTDSAGTPVIGHVGGVAVYDDAVVEATADGVVSVDLIANRITDEDDTTTPRYDQANTYYTVIRNTTLQSVLIEMTEVPTNLRDAMVEDPEPLDPTIAQQLVTDAITEQLPGAVEAEVAGVNLAGDVTGELGATTIPAGSIDAAKVDDTEVQVTSQKDVASGYLGIDANADVIMPPSELSDVNVITGGATRESSGVWIIQTMNLTSGGVAAPVTAGSNGVNVATWTGAGVINVLSTYDANPSGEFKVPTSTGSAHVAYTGRTGTTFTGLTLLSGSGTIATGAMVVTYSSTDGLFGSPALIQVDQVQDYDAGNALGGPRAHTAAPMPGGYEFPRAPVQVEGFCRMGVDASNVLGVGPWGPQNNVVVTNYLERDVKVALGIGFINAPALVAEGGSITRPDRLVPFFGIPGGEQCWSIGYWDGAAYYGLDGGTVDGILSVSYVATAFVWEHAQADIVHGYYAPEVSNTGATAGMTGPNGVIDVQTGVVIGNWDADAALPPTKWTRATVRAGLVNATTTVLPPDEQTVAAAFTVAADSSMVRLVSTAARSANTAGPVIAVPTDPWLRGQVVTLVNGNTDNTRVLTFTHGTTTKLALGAWTRALGSGGSLSLVYDHTKGMWCELSYSPGEFSGVDANRGTYGIMRIATSTATAGSLELTPSPFGALFNLFVNRDTDANPSVSIGAVSHIRLGNGTDPADFYIARTGANAGTLTASAGVTFTGQAFVPDATGATSAVNRQTGDARYLTRAIVDAKGDIVAATAADTMARLAVGTDGQVLVAASGQTTGLSWAGASGISGFDTQVRTNRVDQMAAPTSALSWLATSQLLVGDGTAAHGSAGLGASMFGPSVAVKTLTSDSEASAALTAGAVRLGAGGSTSMAFSIAWTTGTHATITGELLQPLAPTVATALANRAYVQSYATLGRVRKTSDQTVNNSAVKVADSQLVVAVAASTRYRLTGLLHVAGISGGDWSGAITVPSGATLLGAAYTAPTNVASNPAAVNCRPIVAGTSFSHGTIDETLITPVRIEAEVLVSSTAGSVTLTWAQATQTVGDTKVLTGSWLEATPVA